MKKTQSLQDADAILAGSAEAKVNVGAVFFRCGDAIHTGSICVEISEIALIIQNQLSE